LPASEKCLGQDVDKFVATNFPIFVACLRRTHFYRPGGNIIRKEARQKARLAKGAAETLFIFCQTRFTLLFTKLIRQTIDIITLTYQNVEYRKDR